MTIEKTKNTLLQKLLQDVPDIATNFERVHLMTGPWPTNLRQQNDWAYFPDDSLIGLSADTQPRGHGGMVIAGRHGFWLSGPMTGLTLRARVLHEGHIYRLNWRMVQDDPHRFAPCLISAALATQRLIRQMAQMAFCVQHHTPVQRMASCLLVCLQQSSDASLSVRQDDVLDMLRVPADVLQEALSVLQTHSGIRCDPGVPTTKPGPVAVPARLWTQDPQHLALLACDCHRHMNAEASV